MDQHFAEILSDRPPDTPNHKNNNDDNHHHGHDSDHGHGEATPEPHGSSNSNGQATKAKAVSSGHVHGHDRLGAQSVGVELSDRPIDWAKFTAWLKGFLEKEGDLIWRLKGVLWTSTPGYGDSSKSTGWGAGRTVVQVKHWDGRDESVYLIIFVVVCCLTLLRVQFFATLIPSSLSPKKVGEV